MTVFQLLETQLELFSFQKIIGATVGERPGALLYFVQLHDSIHTAHFEAFDQML